MLLDPDAMPSQTLCTISVCTDLSLSYWILSELR